MTTKADIASKVSNRVSDVPTACSTTVIQEWIEDAHITIENRVQESFATSDIPTKFQAVITDMAVVRLLEYKIGTAISAGDINVSYREMLVQKQDLERKIEAELNSIVRGSTGAMGTTEPNDPLD